jgi:hypothetical protein
LNARKERSLARAWWWQSAFEVRQQEEAMAPSWCHRLELPVGSTYADGAAVLLAALADQTSLLWPDKFPRNIAREPKSEDQET